MKTQELVSRKEPPFLEIRAAGFTLIELMVTIAVMAILLGIAVPSFKNAMLGNQLASYGNNLASSALLARSEAIKRNAPVTLCVSSSGTACGTGAWEQGWIVIVGGAVLHRQEALPSGPKVTEAAATDEIIFRPTGVGATEAKFTLSPAAPTTGVQERCVKIDRTGRAEVTKPADGVCT